MPNVTVDPSGNLVSVPDENATPLTPVAFSAPTGSIAPAPAPAVLAPPAPTQVAASPNEAAAMSPGLAPAIATGGQAQPQGAPQKVSLPGDGMAQAGGATPAGVNTQPYDLALQGQAIETRAGMEEGKRASGFYQQAQKKQQDLEDARQVREAERRKLYDEQLSKLSQAETDLSKESIHSDRFWANKSTGQKVALGLSVILGGMASGVIGKENGALKVVENAISQDIEEQKANLAKKQTAIQGQRGLLSEMRQRFQDENVADAATRLAYVNRLDLQLKENMARYQSPKVQAQGMKAAAAIEQERQRYQAQFQQALQVQESKRRLGIGTDQDARDLQNLTDDERKRYFKDSEQGIAGVATTPEGAKSIREMAAETKSQVGMIRELVKLGENEGRQFVPSEASAQAEVLKSVLTGQLRTAIVGPGAMSESELKLLDRVVADPTAIKQVNALTALKKLQVVLNKRLINNAEAQGFKVAKFDAAKPVK